MHKALGFIEKIILMVRTDPDPGRPPVFILGAPRSGTTLLYQLMVNRFNFAYFSNFTAAFYLAPVVGFWLARKRMRAVETENDPDAYRSAHGITQGPNGPNECGEFWYRWFPRGEHVYVAKGTTPNQVLHALRSEVLHVSEMMDASMLFKNVYNTMRIAPILEAIPEAVFLVCHRDPAATARSILRCRIGAGDGKEQWWSLPPKEIDEVRTHPYWDQVVEQVYYTYNQIDEDETDFGSERFLHVQYESLCRDVQAELTRIESFLVSAGVEMVFRGPVPAHFPISEVQTTESDDDRRIESRVKELWNLA
jgi:hypothetical protein